VNVSVTEDTPKSHSLAESTARASPVAFVDGFEILISVRIAQEGQEE
jgi:hypothetical protein